MEKKLNPRMIEYSVEIKTKKELPKSGFDGVVVRLIGTRDSSNPIAINGMYTGKHQLFTVPLSDIGTIQKVFLNRIYDIEEHFQTFMVAFSRRDEFAIFFLQNCVFCTRTTLDLDGRVFLSVLVINSVIANLIEMKTYMIFLRYIP